MDPTLLQSDSNNLRPITFTILPQHQTIPLQSYTPPKQASYIPIQTPNLSIPIRSNIPNFGHVPITPTIVPNNSNTIPPEEKERIRLEKQRQCKTRYNNKVKNYAKLGTIDREEDKVKALLLLCYPWLNNMSNNELDL